VIDGIARMGVDREMGRHGRPSLTLPTAAKMLRDNVVELPMRVTPPKQNDLRELGDTWRVHLTRYARHAPPVESEDETGEDAWATAVAFSWNTEIGAFHPNPGISKEMLIPASPEHVHFVRLQTLLSGPFPLLTEGLPLLTFYLLDSRCLDGMVRRTIQLAPASFISEGTSFPDASHRWRVAEALRLVDEERAQLEDRGVSPWRCEMWER
jgi:hypothetical protein